MSARGQQILIVGSDPLARGGLAHLLGELPGIEGVQVDSGQVSAPLTDRAAAALLDAGPTATPDLDPVRSLAAALPVLVLAASTDVAADAFAAGARSVLPRDVSRAQLAAAIRAVIDGLVVIDAMWASTLLRTRRAREASAEPLTRRELEVLQLLADGLSNKGIAARLHVSEHTAKFHVNAILTKLGAQGRTDAVVRGARLGLVVL